ncbi:hypothetical protein MIMGU_mgv1a004822mg [Erythranthe guttata]|uniref:PX domain-containing protein n=1 Tax=Erythranthe guttata TaxID=4155 RepID=A0A022Q0W2_ERYGU|nr:hypothetical protein MIMGU_mgv1a004822mg [Erythranthe guttata]
MNLYGLDYSLLDVGFDDPTLIESISSPHRMYRDTRHREIDEEEKNLLKLSSSILREIKSDSTPPKRRHDGLSPLPLGMDWSPPPRNWNGPSTIWPHDFQTGWSYCVTVPSCSIFSESGGSEPVTFYRVQVGLQSPLGVTATREVLRRFSDFLKLSSDLNRSFPKKKLPPAPPKGLLRIKSRAVLEERRCALEDWMTKVLSDMDFSRSAPVACFLELEAAARSSFSESSHQVPNINLCNGDSSSDPLSSHTDGSSSEAFHEKNNTEVHQDCGGSSKSCESVEASDTLASSDLQFPNEALVFLPMEEQQKIKRVKDLESELESTKTSGEESLKQAIFLETERFTNLQRDMEELGRKYGEMEDEKTSLVKENEALRQESDSAKEQLKNLQKFHEESDLKSKSVIKFLSGKVKSLRISQSALQQELDRVTKERTLSEVTTTHNGSDNVTKITDDEWRKMVRDAVISNAIPRKRGNSRMRYDLNTTDDDSPDSSGTVEDDISSRKKL